MKQWKSPTFVELRMDAEIGSYQEDSEGERDQPAFASPPGAADGDAGTRLP